MTKKLDRYHKEVFFPKWFNDSISAFTENIIRNNPLNFSLHAVDKLISAVGEFGTILWKSVVETIRNSPLDKTRVFEFYADKSKKIKKACFRYSAKALSVDLILVISDTGTIITIYTTEKEDNHSTMNKNVYKKE